MRPSSHVRERDNPHQHSARTGKIDLRALLNTSAGKRDPGFQSSTDAEHFEGTSILNMPPDEDSEDSLSQTNQWDFYRY